MAKTKSEHHPNGVFLGASVKISGCSAQAAAPAEPPRAQAPRQSVTLAQPAPTTRCDAEKLFWSAVQSIMKAKGKTRAQAVKEAARVFSELHAAAFPVVHGCRGGGAA